MSSDVKRKLYWLVLLTPGIVSGFFAFLVNVIPLPPSDATQFGLFSLLLAMICGPAASYMVARQTKFRYQNKALLAVVLAPVFTIFSIALTIPGCAAMPVRVGG